MKVGAISKIENYGDLYKDEGFFLYDIFNEIVFVDKLEKYLSITKPVKIVIEYPFTIERRYTDEYEITKIDKNINMAVIININKSKPVEDMISLSVIHL